MKYKHWNLIYIDYNILIKCDNIQFFNHLMFKIESFEFNNFIKKYPLLNKNIVIVKYKNDYYHRNYDDNSVVDDVVKEDYKQYKLIKFLGK